MTEQAPVEVAVIPARRARSAARIFSYGNLLAMVIPLPLGILWMGVSMVVYAMNRHHPNPRVGHYTQLAAYKLYGVMGMIVVVATFFGTELQYWLVTWVISALILVPGAIYDLWQINKEHWHDVSFEGESQ